MAFTLRSLRVGLVVGAALLVAVVAGFVWYAQRATHSWLKKLPKQLGIHIVQETDHFTYSQSLKGKTVFTVRAAKESTYDNGTVKLYDAGIELYGRQDGKADRIHGAEFDFDQKAGLLKAIGDVYIDLAAPDAKNGKPSNDDSRMIHVKTSGLIFDQKARTAATNERVEFAAAQLTGSSIGADYDSATGVMVLRSAVHVSGQRGGRPVDLAASHAVMDRPHNLITLETAKYQTTAESVAGDHAVVLMAADGTPQHVQAEGHVTLSSPGKGMATGQKLDLELNPTGQPREGHLWGGVVFHARNEQERNESKDIRAQAQDVRVAFNALGRPTHALLTGGVQMEERAGTAGRSLQADQVDLRLSEVVKGKVLLEQADAKGAASLRLADANEKGRTATDVSADQLQAHFIPNVAKGAAAREKITSLTGSGHTVVHQVAATGAEETSSGAALEARFTEDGRGIEHAVQHGGVKTVRGVPAANGKPAELQHAAAETTTYDGLADTLTLAGAVQLSDATSDLSADSVALEHKTGDARAEGNVRVSYAAADSKGEPVHVTASSALERHDAGFAEFYGATGHNARMWQGMLQVEAPVLRLEQEKAGRRMIASGGSGVRALLVSDGAKKSVVKLTGRQMTYSEATQQVVVDGPVRIEQQGGTVTAKQATAYLAASGTKPTGSSAFPAGNVERLVAEGAVQVEEPGRRATGDKLVYTAADQTFLMTGSKAVPPRMTDDEQGMVTGASLRFRSGDKAVMVSGDEAGGSTGRVHSETRVKQP